MKMNSYLDHLHLELNVQFAKNGAMLNSFELDENGTMIVQHVYTDRDELIKAITKKIDEVYKL